MLQGLLGLVVFVALAWALSERRAIPDWRVIVVGIGMQLALAVLMIKIPLVAGALEGLNAGVAQITGATEAGTRFVFGYLGGAPDPVVNPYPYDVVAEGATVILAFRVLPLILVFTVLSALLWHLQVLPLVIRGFAFVLTRSLGVNGAVGVSAAANIFIGMVESPVLIRPYLAKLSRSELFMVMTCGMATIAGSVMILYSIILSDIVDNAIGHILTASVISAPAALMVAKLMVPGEGATPTGTELSYVRYDSLMDAVTRGTADGVRLVVNVAALLVVLVALVALVNGVLGLFPGPGDTPLTLQGLLGYLFFPVVWLMGIPADECLIAGSLMGTKTVLNELLAYSQMAGLAPDALSEKSEVVMTYALCGFANLGSLGIMIGGIAGICPERREEILALAPTTLISGTIANCMTGTLVGLIL